jgi:hypothetical protein
MCGFLGFLELSAVGLAALAALLGAGLLCVRAVERRPPPSWPRGNR